jgi:hypothetical protein
VLHVELGNGTLELRLEDLVTEHTLKGILVLCIYKVICATCSHRRKASIFAHLTSRRVELSLHADEGFIANAEIHSMRPWNYKVALVHTTLLELESSFHIFRVSAEIAN